MNIWLLFFCGGAIVAFVGHFLSEESYQQSWEMLYGVLSIAGMFFALVGLIGMLISGSQPTTTEVCVDRVEYVERDAEHKHGLLVVNFLDTEGHLLSQFRQSPAPEALATLLHTLVDKSQHRIFVTHQSGGDTGYRITRVEVWHSRLDPPEVHKFK